MNAARHVVLGAAAGALAALAPDAALALFGWRRRWLPESHPLVRVHRFTHSPAGVVVPVVAGWVSHVVADAWSWHRAGPDGERVRGNQ